MTIQRIRGFGNKPRLCFQPKTFAARARQRGVSLLLALVFVSVFGGALATIAGFNAYRVRENEARVTGIEMIEIAKAARLFVRQEMINNPALRTDLNAGPRRITLTQLKDAGFLSQNFGRVAGTDDLTALGQRIYVIETNWPIGGDPASNNTVPTAFVLLRDSSKSTAQLMVNAVEVARQMNSSLTAPRFNTLGNNISSDCRGAGPAASLWDTGCLADHEFTALMAAVPTPPAQLEDGGLIVPTWKIVQPDLRAVMRFPQPENPGFATMLTDLQMGIPLDDCTNAATQVQITTTDAAGNVTSVPSGLCDAETDTATDNKRFNITEISNMSLQRIIAEPQNFDNNGSMAAEVANIGTTNDDAMRISGDVTLGNDLRIYDQRALPGGVPSRLNIPNGTMVAERNAYLYSNELTRGGQAVIGGTVQSRGLIANRLDTPTFQSTSASPAGYGSDAPSINVTSTTDLTGDIQITGATGELITETLNAAAGPDNAATPTINEARTGANMTASDTTGQVQITGTITSNNNPIVVQGANPIVNGGVNYSAIIGSLSNGGNIQVDNGMTFTDATNTQITAGATRGYASATTPITNISTTRCLTDNAVANGCPNRQYTPPGITP